jgi:hypothetical protein
MTHCEKPGCGATLVRCSGRTHFHRADCRGGDGAARRHRHRGARVGDLAQTSLATSSRFFELDATAWSNNTVRVLARNVSNTPIDLAAATLSVQVAKRRIP